ncbi:MAG: pyridoxal phosphate-dependent aminotransferase [Candidatus Kapaibacterium sp.]|jgi:aspartate aminotransferase
MSHTLAKHILAAEESQTLAIANRAKAMKSQGIDVVSLSTGEPDFPTPDCAKQAAYDAIAHNFTHYTDSNGIKELRDAVAEKFRTENGISLANADNILITTGAKQALVNTLAAICNEGDEVIIFSPFWVSYPAMVTMTGATPIIIKTLAEHDFKPTPEQLRDALTPQTKCVIFNSPNNPTGMMLTREEMGQLLAVLENHDCYILSDEIYEKLTLGRIDHCSPGSFPSVAARVCTVNGVSKAFAMTGWRIGFLHAPPEVWKQASKVQGQVTSHPSSIAQKAALGAMLGAQHDVQTMREVFCKRKELICRLMSAIPAIAFAEPQGAFYVWADISRILTKEIPSSAAFCEKLLADYHLALVPGEAFGEQGYIRLSFAASDEVITKAIERLAAMVNDMMA